MNLSHVAEAAGVSISTVSRVVNGFGWVKPETAQRVEAAMRSLKFDPSTVRRGPRKGSRHKPPPVKTAEYVALLLVGEARRLLERPVFAEVLAGVSDGARRRGAMVVIEELPDRASLEHFLQTRPQIAGAVAIMHQQAQELLELIRQRMPVVWVMGEGARSWAVDHVAPDNLAIGAVAYKYLVDELHCERVAFWTTMPERTIFGIRYVGFAQAALAAGRETPSAFLMTRDPLLTESFGIRASHAATAEELAALLHSASPRPTGVFIPADIQVAALQAALRAQGVATDSFHVISVDNEQRLLTTMDPRPATIDTQPRQLGRLAAERLFHRMTHPDPVPASMLLAPKIVRPGDKNHHNNDEAPMTASPVAIQA